MPKEGIGIELVDRRISIAKQNDKLPSKMAMAAGDEYDVLPLSIKPVHYDLFLFDLDLDEDNADYKGIVEIEVIVKETTNVLTLNTHLLDILSAQARFPDGDIELKTIKILHDERRQRCELHFAQALVPSLGGYRMTIHFKGRIDDNLAGFYRFKTPSFRSSDHQHTYTYATQFEPSDARRAFPCFDEPGWKATFAFSVQIPEKLTVLSNMPMARTTPDVSKPGYKVVDFECTPVMSTYLLAWAIGSFDHVEAIITRKHSGTSLPIRVYTPSGQKDSAAFALDMACRTIQLFSEWYGIDYPLPKLDLIGLLELSDDAMENWGLVTFRTTALLIDTEDSDLDSITFAAYVIAHELAHQWFGNLVTMTWWDDLWLNEGFATWAGWAACHEFFPEWDVWGQFLVDDMVEALDLDSLSSSHPIQALVTNDLEVDSFFDTISYLKSAAVIRMLAAYLGQDVLLKGVRNYLKANLYGSATADDLWEELSRASDKDVALLMDPWIKQIGYPLIIADQPSPSLVSIQQDEASLSVLMPWSVPIISRVAGETRVDVIKDAAVRLNVQDQVIKLNVGHAGFFRTRYSSSLLQKLIANTMSMSNHDQVGLLIDAMSLAWSTSKPSTDIVLTMLCNLAQSSDAVVWSAIDSTLHRLQSIFSDDVDIQEGLNKLIRRLTQPVLRTLGQTFHAEESYNTKRLRTILIPLPGLAGNQAELQMALTSFDAWQREEEEDVVHPFLLPAVLDIAVKHIGAKAVDTLWNKYTSNEDPDEREMIAAALGQIQVATVARTCLSRAFDKTSPMVAQDAATMVAAMARNGAVRDTLWCFIAAEWPAFTRKLAGSMAVFDPCIRNTLQHFATDEALTKIDSFFADKETTGYTRGLAVAKDFVIANAAYRKRDLDCVKAWLGSSPQ